MCIKEDWLEKRFGVITATEVSAMMGLNPYLHPSQLFQNKKNRTKVAIDDDRFLRAGQMLESGAIQFALKYDFGIHAGRFDSYEFFQKGYLGSTPDGFIEKIDEEIFFNNTNNAHLLEMIKGENVLLEYKTGGTTKLKTWMECPPVSYLLQCQTQLITMPEMEKVILVLCLRNDTLPISIWKIDRNKELQNMILNESKKFQDCIRKDLSYEIASHISIITQELASHTSEFLCHGKGHKLDRYGETF